jgi:nicotinamidase-related amidase
VALVVVDVQYEFNPQAGLVERPVLALIERAKRYREAVFVVRFERCGKNLASVEKAIADYPLAFRVLKNDQDGSPQLERAICEGWEQGLYQRFSVMRFCGVYTSQCVADTFLGMCAIAAESGGWRDETALYPSTRMELVAAACADPFYNKNRGFGLIRSQQKQFPNMRITENLKYWENTGKVAL